MILQAWPRPAPTLPWAATPGFAPVTLGAYQCHNIQLKAKPNKKLRGVIPRVQQNRISAQRVRDRQKAYQQSLENRISILEAENAKILNEIKEFKQAHGLVLEPEEPEELTNHVEITTPPCLSSPSPLSPSSFTSDETWGESLATFSRETWSPLSFSSVETDYESMVVSSPEATCGSGESNTSRSDCMNEDNVVTEDNLQNQSEFDKEFPDFLSFWNTVSKSVFTNISELSCESAVLAFPQQQEALLSFVLLLMILFNWTTHFSKTTLIGSSKLCESAPHLVSLLKEMGNKLPAEVAALVKNGKILKAYYDRLGIVKPLQLRSKTEPVCS